MLYLLPNCLALGNDPSRYFPEYMAQVIASLDGLIAESESQGRALLKKFTCKKNPYQIPIAVMSGKFTREFLDFLLEPVQKGEKWGVVSDAGLPCIADPGSLIVKRAYEKKITVEAIIGPSSIFLALMLSGLPGQRFAFRGYPEQNPQARQKELRTWELSSKKERATQIFIETPYRNYHTLQDCLHVLAPETQLAVAFGLTTVDEKIITAKIHDWRKMEIPQLRKIPAVFLFNSN